MEDLRAFGERKECVQDRKTARYEMWRKIMESHTSNRLWREEIVHRRLHPRIRCDVINRLLPVLEDHPAFQVREPPPQLFDLASERATNIDEESSVGNVVLVAASSGRQLLLEGVEVEPVSAPLALGGHEDVEVVEGLGVFGEPFEPVVVGPHAVLERGVEAVCGVLVMRFGQCRWERGPTGHEAVYAVKLGSEHRTGEGSAGTYKSPAPEMPFGVVKALEIFVAVYVSGPASATASILARHRRIRPSSVASALVSPASCWILFGAWLSIKDLNMPRSTARRMATKSTG